LSNVEWQHGNNDVNRESTVMGREAKVMQWGREHQHPRSKTLVTHVTKDTTYV